MEDENPEPGPSNWRSRSSSRSRIRNDFLWRGSNINPQNNLRNCNLRGGFGQQFRGGDRGYVGSRPPNHSNGSSQRQILGLPYQHNEPLRRPTNAGRPRNMRPRHNDDRFKFIGFRTLEEIANADTKDVLQKINERREPFLKLTDSSIDRHDIFVLLMQILSKISKTPFVELKSKLILDVCNSNFISNLRNYMMDLPYADNKSSNNLYWKDQYNFWKNFIIFCEDVVEISPSTALRKCRALIEGISKTCLESLHQRHGFILPEEYTLKLKEIQEKLTTFGDTHQPEGKRPRVDDTQNVQPPENFRQLSVVPTRDDLLGSQPFLRPNIVKGGYIDVEHYLDVQFRLLREDCFGPFREGINQFLGNPNKKKYDHVRIFHNVKFVCPYVDNLKIGALVQIDTSTNRNFKRTNWAHNKRFLFGSLVLFTKDHCTSFIAATILDRDLNLLSTGKLPVSIIDATIDNSIYNDDTYTMIESEVYFEPYFHVLKALQEPSFPRHLAMQQYIVKVDPGSKPPAYLTAEKEYLIRNSRDNTDRDEINDLYMSLLEDDLIRRRNSDDSDDDSGNEDTDNKDYIKFKPLQLETWPTKDELNFNESQYEAYRLALTHEFAVIQGPPGTGKTYIGINVAKTLLRNIKSSKGCLMLIICYTNHALDQFLEAISKITKSIVRIGSQSRNKSMDEFNLTNLRRASHSSHSSHIFYIEQKNRLRNSIQSLQEALMVLDILNNGVASYYYLKDDVHEIEFLDGFYKNRGIIVDDPLRHWLFEKKSEYYNDFKDCIAEYDNLVDEDDSDKRRTGGRMVLDDDNTPQDQNKLESIKKEKASFSIIDAKLTMKMLVSRYKASRDFNEKYMLQIEILELNSMINLFSDMMTYRDREVRLYINAKTNFSAITLQNRWCLYFSWVKNKITEVKEEVANLQVEISPSVTAYDEARMMMDLQLLINKGVKVVGMTTSGAARMRKLLQAIAPKIVIVEEAAEVLEQHIITSLTQDCQHLILIGDHQQLRPSASHIQLARQYNIEVSLFERMITNGIHSRRLNVQHRMRPEIAALISPHIYSDLANHPSVETFTDVPGIEKNLYFFTHDYKEEEFNDSNSRANHKEADMTLALANYLMQQGYVAEDITILAAYSGQMFYMRKERQNFPSLSQVKITVVDNYQGEESQIILLSLVRNNTENRIGFLGTENRICVALSRAKQGFYIFGNINMLKEKSELWRKIAVTLENNGSLGSTLILKCQNHPEQITTITTPEDFNKLPPEGGCFEKCNYQYHCGHTCIRYCHGYDRQHLKTECTMKCERVLCDLGHVCPLKCKEVCEPCKVYVMKSLPCGHEMNVYCHREPDDPNNQCLTKIDVTLPDCGHQAKKDCYMNIKNVKCTEPCVYRLEECGHVCSRKCHVTKDPKHERYICLKPCARAKKGCTADLIGDRGDHQCRKSCNEKCDDCHVQVMKKRSNCKHVERVACCVILDEKPCMKKCARTMSCGHFCKKKCSEPCGNCTQMVTKIIPECEHKVKVQCKDTVTRKLCNEKCTRQLSCGHPCKDRCGAECDASRCKKLSDRDVMSPCGHNVKLPCNVLAAYDKGEINSEQLLKYCTAACGTELECGHSCKGSCASCQQGRLHAPCTEPCPQINICGHRCLEPCNRICPPCKMLCEVKCPHSHCKKLCCEPCVPCQEKCSRKCPHGACARRCGEPCTRRACDERCALRQPCGHPCRGLCGEPCPPVCHLCRPDDFPTDFLGDEYGPDDKFILLQDCGHVLEIENMDNLMLGDQDNIKIRTCPYCRKPIINTNRYKDSVNNMFKNDINPIKERVFGTKQQIAMKMVDLRSQLTTFIRKYRHLTEDFTDTFEKFMLLIKKQKSSLLEVEMQCVYLNIFEMIAECWENYLSKRSVTTPLKDEIQNHMKMLLNFLKINPKSNVPIKLSAQQQKDVGNEIKRLNAIVQLSRLLDTQIKAEPKITNHIETTKANVFTFTLFNEDKAIESLNSLQQTIKSSNDIITKHERALIVSAIGLRAGHWYKCPNGHFYCIGECGGAMEQSKCPDCGALIGGSSHTLIANNAHAPEMDGSSFPAWSQQNNLANFDIDNII